MNFDIKYHLYLHNLDPDRQHSEGGQLNTRAGEHFFPRIWEMMTTYITTKNFPGSNL